MLGSQSLFAVCFLLQFWGGLKWRWGLDDDSRVGAWVDAAVAVNAVPLLEAPPPGDFWWCSLRTVYIIGIGTVWFTSKRGHQQRCPSIILRV